jgi:hypothetical protein
LSVFIKDKKKFKRHKAKKFKDEEELGRLIIDHPEIVPVDQFSELGGDLIPITREMKLETGELDVLGINKEGEIFLIENKLWRNTSDKKKVRSQAADYIFALLNLKEYFDGWDQFRDLIKKANKYEESKGRSFQDKSLEEIIEKNVGKEDSEECLKNVKHNFDEGNYTLIVAMDEIPKALRISIDGWNEVAPNEKIPAFAIEINQFQTNKDTIAVASTYPYNLEDAKRKKSSRGNKNYDAKDFQKSYEKEGKPNLKEDKRKIFDKFREEIVKLSSDTWYANGRVPQLTLKFNNIGGGRNWVVDLSPNGKLRIIFENLYRWDNSNQLFKRTQADTLKKKFETTRLYKIWKDTGKWGRYNLPEEWMPDYKKILKILKEVEI